MSYPWRKFLPVLLLLTTLSVNATPRVGEIRATASRSVVPPCSGGAPFIFGMWEQQRSIMTTLCFEVYEQGVSDWENPDAWQMLDVQLHYRWSKEAPYQSKHVNRWDRAGNNIRYVFDYRQFNPFYNGYHLCPTEDEVTIKNLETSESAVFDFYITVNEATLGTAEAPLTIDYYNTARDERREFCQSVL